MAVPGAIDGFHTDGSDIIAIKGHTFDARV